MFVYVQPSIRAHTLLIFSQSDRNLLLTPCQDTRFGIKQRAALRLQADDDRCLVDQVRLSVVELYNEELSDLIAATDDDAKGHLRKLRLLEDPKKGVVLQVRLVPLSACLFAAEFSPPF